MTHNRLMLLTLGKARRRLGRMLGPPLLIVLSACDDSRPAEQSAQASVANTSAAAASDEPTSMTPEASRVEHTSFATDAIYAPILEAVVVEYGGVNYRLLGQEPLRSQLHEVVSGYAHEALPDAAQSDSRMALWCNAYNANMLLITLEESTRPGFTSIKDVPDLFSGRLITVAGEEMTLNALEDRMRSLGDPRMHAALAWGARSCPPLRAEPYAAARLDEQFDQQCTAWLDDPGKHRSGRRGLLVSQIFEWYGDDFEVEPYRGVLGFIRKHGRSGGTLRNLIRGMGGSPAIGYLPFNWTLNGPMLPDEPTADPTTQPSP